MFKYIVLPLLAVATLAPTFSATPESWEVAKIILLEVDNVPQGFLFISTKGDIESIDGTVCVKDKECLALVTKAEKSKKTAILKLESDCADAAKKEESTPGNGAWSNGVSGEIKQSGK